MTNIRLVYNPFTGQTRIYNENQEITAKENRLCAFLCPGGFESCLLPFRRRYTVWEGLLPELLRFLGDYYQITYCILVLISALFLPNGLISLYGKVMGAFNKKSVAEGGE